VICGYERERWRGFVEGGTVRFGGDGVTREEGVGKRGNSYRVRKCFSIAT
jgi:hypothetical protein